MIFVIDDEYFFGAAGSNLHLKSWQEFRKIYTAAKINFWIFLRNFLLVILLQSK